MGANFVRDSRNGLVGWVGFTIVSGLEVLAWVVAHELRGLFTPATTMMLRLVLGLIPLFALTVIGRVEGLTSMSLGFKKPRLTDLLIGLLTGFATFFLYPLLAWIVRHFGLGGTESGILTLNELPRPLLWLLPFYAAFTEELLFRGYAMARLRDLTGSPAAGVFLPWLAWTAMHVTGWGVGGTLIIAFMGLMFTGAYLWRKTLWTAITAHALNDFLAFVILPIVIKLH